MCGRYPVSYVGTVYLSTHRPACPVPAIAPLLHVLNRSTAAGATIRLAIYASNRSTRQQRAPCCAEDERPIDAACQCATCRGYSRAALHSALCHSTPAGPTLVSVHNVAYTQNLTRRIRAAITAGEFPGFVRQFMRTQHGEGGSPQWVRDALAHVGIDVP